MPILLKDTIVLLVMSVIGNNIQNRRVTSKFLKIASNVAEKCKLSETCVCSLQMHLLCRVGCLMFIYSPGQNRQYISKSMYTHKINTGCS